MFAWIGLALLSASWLFGLEYYHRPEVYVWLALVALGTLCLTGLRGRLPSRSQSAVAGLMILPAAILAPGPFRAAFVLLLAGLAVHAALKGGDSASGVSRLVARLATATVLSGVVLLGQMLALLSYEVITSRSHDLPTPLVYTLATALRAVGIDAGISGHDVPVFSMRQNHYLGATWELLLDPVSLCFLVGGVLLWLWRQWSDGFPRESRRRSIGALTLFLLAMAIWLPLRAGIYTGVFLNSVLRTEYEEPLNAVRWYWSGWMHLALLAIPVLAAWRTGLLVSRKPSEESAPSPVPGGAIRPAAGRLPLAAALACAAAAVISVGIYWDPVGERQQGRILIEEYHPNPDKIWEPTFKAMDTNWYGHLSGYNYYCIFDYLSRFYHVSRTSKPLDAATLRGCDVLVLKTPTRAYSAQEIQAVHDFARRGGGVLLIGEHTDVFGTGTYLNRFSEEFGFRFVPDCLFGVDSVFEQRYESPLVPHPAAQFDRWHEFATSCSLDVRKGTGRAVIRSTGLKSKLAEYHVENFYPVPSDTAAERYGAFVQLWSTRYGAGRVLAFTDSTIFSNFCVFEPGKSELMMSMVEWLNHRDGWFDPRPWLVVLGVFFGLGAMAAAWRRDGAWLVLMAAAALGWSGAAVGVASANRAAMPRPEILPGKSLVRVVMDQKLNTAILPKNGFIAGKPDGFGIFERWILRLGYFTSREDGPGEFAGNLLVIPNPSRRVPQRFQRQLVDWVQGGGKLLVLDSRLNQASTSAELLKPFGIYVDHSVSYRGLLSNTEGWEPIPVENAVPVEGGQVFARVGEFAVGTSLKFGKGTVTVVGFGSRFNDLNMGFTGDVEPNDAQKRVYAVDYSMLRSIIAGKVLGQPEKAAK